MTHILTVTLTDEECLALREVLSPTAHLSACREVLFKLNEIIGSPHLF